MGTRYPPSLAFTVENQGNITHKHEILSFEAGPRFCCLIAPVTKSASSAPPSSSWRLKLSSFKKRVKARRMEVPRLRQHRHRKDKQDGDQMNSCSETRTFLTGPNCAYTRRQICSPTRQRVRMGPLRHNPAFKIFCLSTIRQIDFRNHRRMWLLSLGKKITTKKKNVSYFISRGVSNVIFLKSEIFYREEAFLSGKLMQYILYAIEAVYENVHRN